MAAYLSQNRGEVKGQGQTYGPLISGRGVEDRRDREEGEKDYHVICLSASPGID